LDSVGIKADNTISRTIAMPSVKATLTMCNSSSLVQRPTAYAVAKAGPIVKSISFPGAARKLCLATILTILEWMNHSLPRLVLLSPISPFPVYIYSRTSSDNKVCLELSQSFGVI